jgi:hypothetical protein
MSKIEFEAIAEILSDADEQIKAFQDRPGRPSVELSAEEIRRYIGDRLEIVLAERAGPGGFDAARFRHAAKIDKSY